jgi:hypothetical protein
MYVGVGGVARKVRAAHIGDADGKARCFFGEPWPPGIITPDNMTSDSAPAPFRSKAKNIWSYGYESYRTFSASNIYLCTLPGVVSTSTGFISDGEWWEQIDLGVMSFANRGRIKSDSSRGNRSFPNEFQILGSNDADAWNDNPTSDKWTVTGVIAGYARSADAWTWGAYFDLDNPGYYRYYRLRVTKCAPTPGYSLEDYITIGQIELSAA